MKKKTCLTCNETLVKRERTESNAEFIGRTYCSKKCKARSQGEVNISGNKYNKLTAIKFFYKKGGKYFWEFKCDCGNIHITSKSCVTRGQTKSCGCISILNPPNMRHGLAKKRFNRIYYCMLQRCNYHNHVGYKNYGGRGISVKWKSFLEFKNDMYESYLEHSEKFGEEQTTLDRIDNDGNYYKENCRWATRKEQSNNRR